MFAIGLDTFSQRFQRWTPTRLVKWAAEHGFRTVSLDARELPGLSVAEARRIRTAAERYGARLLLSGGPLLTLSGRARVVTHQVSANVLRHWVDLCHGLGVSGFRTFALERTSVRWSWEDIRQPLTSCLYALLDEFQQQGVVISLENHRDLYSEELVQLVKAIDCSLLGVCFDLGNQASVGEVPERALSRLRPHIVMYHVKDVAFRSSGFGYCWRSVPLGVGALPLQHMFASMRSEVAPVPILLEISTSRPTTFTPWRSLRNVRERDFFKTHVRAHGAWPEEIATYVDRDTDEMDLVARQELQHLLRCIEWLNDNRLGVPG